VYRNANDFSMLILYPATFKSFYLKIIMVLQEVAKTVQFRDLLFYALCFSHHIDTRLDCYSPSSCPGTGND
jgi:hypothetical protein